MINQNFIYVAAALNLAGAATYIIATLKGQTRPNRVSWFMWALAPMVATAAMLVQGVGVGALTTFMSGFGPLLIFIASFINSKSYWKLSSFDLVCGALSLLGLILWAITRTSNIALLFSILADGLAVLPTLRKAYLEPESENYTAFILSGIASLITLLTINTWTLEYYAFPLYLLTACASITVVGLYRSYKLKKHSELGQA